MELTSDFVGGALKEYVCRISARWTMNYAAAIGDSNPLYFNDERPEGIIAPPLFPVAMTWPIIENIADHIEAVGFPKEILLTQVHYTEHLHIHRPVKPGGDIGIRGSVAAILPHRAGAHVVIRFDATDADGQALFTEHIGAMMRGVQCTDSGKGSEQLPAVPPNRRDLRHYGMPSSPSIFWRLSSMTAVQTSIFPSIPRWRLPDRLACPELSTRGRRRWPWPFILF